MPARIDPTDILGIRHAKLTPVEVLGHDAAGYLIYRCVCSCNGTNEVVVRRRCLINNETRQGGVRSCGCLRRNNGKHGNQRRYYTPEMQRAQAMKDEPQIPYRIIRHHD